jgi:hypothetical protein
MEVILNFAWALCSLGLVWFWTRNTEPSSISRGKQALALAMVVLLLLPVISLSDDLMAMQGPAESDTYLRRALHSGDSHPSAFATSFALPEQIISALALTGYSQELLEDDSPTNLTDSLPHSLQSRPPPQA